MDFENYLQSSKRVAEEERAILDELSRRQILTPIEIRAAQRSLQILVENAIGKSRRILKHYGCPIVPRSSRDAISFLYEVGMLDDELYGELLSAIGFRNVMIHDYMNFSESKLLELLGSRRWESIARFVESEVSPDAVQISRIEHFTL